MKEKRKSGFFNRMLKGEHPAFEITMFSVSIAVALAVLVGVIWVGYYYVKGQTSHFTEEEVNAGTVTDSAVEVDKEEVEPVETLPPDGDAIINEDTINTADEDLKNADSAYTTSTVNLRQDAALTATVLAKIPLGAKVTILKYDGKEWAKVSYEGQEGFVNAMYLSVDKPTPIATVAPTTDQQTTATETPATKKPRKTPKPEETVAPDETEKPERTKKPPAEPTEEPELPPTEAPAPTEPPAPTEAPPEPTEAPAPPAEPTVPPAE